MLPGSDAELPHWVPETISLVHDSLIQLSHDADVNSADVCALAYSCSFSCMFFAQSGLVCRRLAVDAAESQGVKRRRSQLDVDKAFASVF